MFRFKTPSKHHNDTHIEYSMRGGQGRQRAGRARKGSILVIVCMAIPMMIGCCALAVDYGILTVDANRLQRACDAAALAGASKLKKTNDDADKELARTEAVNVAARNGVTLLRTDVTFPEDLAAPIEWSPNTRILVQGRFTRQLLFMRFWQWNNSTLNRRATAQVTSITGARGVVPLVVTTTDYNAYYNGAPLSVDLIRMQSRTDFAPGRFIGISTPGNTDNIPDGTPTPTPTPATNGKGNGNGNGNSGNNGNGNNGGNNDSGGNNGKSPSHWANEVQNGTTVVVNVGDNDVSINASLNNQINRMNAAFTDRINDAAAAGWPGSLTPAEVTAMYPNYPGSADRRVFTIAVADPTAATTGNQNVVLLNFVKVYLVSWDESNGRAVFRLMPNSTVGSENTYVTGNGATNTGLSFIRMIDDL